MNRDTFIIGLLVIVTFTMAFALLVVSNNFESRAKQLEEAIIAEENRIFDFNKQYVYQIDVIKDDIFSLDERVDEAELRLDDHVANMVKIKNEIDKLKVVSPTPTPKASSRKVSVRLSENDIQLIAKLVYEEAGAQSYKCQKAIASVVINRMIRYNKTARQVIFEPGVFSVSISGTRASAESIRAVRDVVKNGTTLPKNVLAFRNQHYHGGFGRPYCHIDGVYFSTM